MKTEVETSSDSLEVLSHAAARVEKTEPKPTLTRISELVKSRLRMDVDLFDFVELGFEHILAPPSIVWVVFVKLDWTNTW